MHMRCCTVVPALLSFSLVASTGAQLLVSPNNVSSRHASTDVVGTNPPSGAGNLHVAFDPTFHANSNSHSSSGPSTGNEVRRLSSYDTVFFSEFPTGLINSARAQGKAEALAKVGATSSQNITATATAETRLEFDVTEPVNYRLFGSISLSNVAGTGPGFGNAMTELYLYRGGFIMQALSATSYVNGTVPFDLTGTLQPGLYRLQARAGASGTAYGLNSLWSSSAAYDSRIDFTPVPTPGALSLLVVAVLTAGRRARS